jgi:hypothetical protein
MKTARAVSLVAALSAAACGTPLLKLPPGPGAPASDAADAFAQATAVCGRVSTISAEVAVSGSVNGQRLRGRILAGLASPSAAYLEAPAPFGAPLFIFAANGGQATLLLPRDRRVLERGEPAAVLEAIAGVPLDPPELRAALTGCATADAAAFAQGTSLGSDWRKLPGDGQQLYLRRERTSAPWRLVAAIHEGDTGWRADYRDFVGDLPRTIRLTSLAPRAFDLRLELSQVEINVPLDAATLRVSVPPGTQPITIDELRDGGPLAR